MQNNDDMNEQFYKQQQNKTKTFATASEKERKHNNSEKENNGTVRHFTETYELRPILKR